MKFLSNSLQLRVVANVFTTSLLVILMISGLIFSQIRMVTETLARENLLEQAKRIASFIEYDWKGSFDLDMPRRFRDYYADKRTSHFAVLDSKGRVLFRSKHFIRKYIENTETKSGKHYFSINAKPEKHLIGLKYDYLFEGKIYPIYVIENEAEFSQFIRTLEKHFLTNILSYGVPLLLLQALIILFIFRKTLLPVINAAADAQNIKYDNLSYRLNETNIHNELRPLIQSINNGLARLEKSAEAQKFFIANAAHELRTPISILKARIASLKDEKEILLLNDDLRNINRLIGQMLDISRMDLTQSIPKTDVSLNEIAKKACADMGALFVTADKELSLEQKHKGEIVNANEDILFRAVLNLLENALKHTPDKTPVKVIVDEKKIIVRDYGNPIPEKYQKRIFERFEKLPESANTKGSGLGLAIIQKAAQIHGGNIYLKPRKDGNDFILDLSTPS